MIEWGEIFKFTAAVLASLGGAAALLGGFSNWLGKIWADRLMERERAKHSADLANLRDDLQSRQNERIANLQNELDIFKETHL